MFIPLPPSRGWQGAYHPSAGRAAGGLPPGRGAAGSPHIKAEPPPTPAFAANNIHREKKERRGVREGVATAKHCRIPHL